MDNLASPQKITGLTHQYRYTVATLVTDMGEYREMIASFRNSGFTSAVCEFIYIDNTATNCFDAYEGINLMLQTAKGKYVLVVHQDVLLNFDTIHMLDARIDQMDKLDPNWAVLSNAGGIENNLYGRIAVHVVYADGFEQIQGTLPQKVCSVDEHFYSGETIGKLIAITES